MTPALSKVSTSPTRRRLSFHSETFNRSSDSSDDPSTDDTRLESPKNKRIKQPRIRKTISDSAMPVNGVMNNEKYNGRVNLDH